MSLFRLTSRESRGPSQQNKKIVYNESSSEYGHRHASIVEHVSCVGYGYSYYRGNLGIERLCAGADATYCIHFLTSS